MGKDDLEKIKKRNRELTPPSELWLGGYNYQALRFRYNINEFMDLEVKKTVLIKFEPYILRYHSISYGRNALERLRDGIYILKVGFQKDYFS